MSRSLNWPAQPLPIPFSHIGREESRLKESAGIHSTPLEQYRQKFEKSFLRLRFMKSHPAF